MLEFLVDNIFVLFAGKVFQQTVGIPMGTNCASLLADIFLYSFEADFVQSLLSMGKKHLAYRFNLTYKYIDDVLSINNPEFENYRGHMYPAELEIKDTTESTTSASYLDLLLSIWRDGQPHASIYDKRDDFNFHITNFPFLSSNIPSSPAYGVFISQLMRYARACSSYECFILRARRLSSKLLKQGYLVERLKSSFRKFYWRYGDLIQQYEVSLSRILNDIHTLDQQWLPNQSDFPPIPWPWYRLWPSPNYEWFPGSICNGCGMPAGNAYSAYLVPSLWDLHMFYLLRPILFRTCRYFSGLCSRNIPRYFLDFTQQYEVSLSQMLNDILIINQQWLPNQSDFPPISWPLYRAWPSPIMSGFHGAFATDVACQQGTLTLPDTWFRPPFWDLLMLQLLRPNSSNLPCLYSIFHLEYPLVLSRFCLDTWGRGDKDDTIFD